MKKVLLNLFACILFSSLSAQTILSEDFETSKKTMPAGWTQQLASSAPTNYGWFFDTTFGGYMAPYVPSHTYYAFVNDYDNNWGPNLNEDSLYTPSMNFTGYSHIFVTYDVWFYGFYWSTPGDYEVAALAASTDGGKTWTQVAAVPCLEGYTKWYTVTYDLSAYANQPNVKLAFTYDDLGNQTSGVAVDNIKVYVPILYDVGVTSDYMWYLCQTGNSYTVDGILHNFGADTITSFRLNYSVNGGPTVSDNIASVSINPLTDYIFSHSTLWTPSSPGNYVMKIWADNLNGSNMDQNHPNDTLLVDLVVMDTLQPKMPLFEEFMQASCHPCTLVSPNIDSVLYNNRNNCNVLRYHCNFPGRDFINEVAYNSINPRVDYYGDIYGGTGIPNARIDGIDNLYPGYLSSTDIQDMQSVGSPFSIAVSLTYDKVNNKYNATANITAHAAMPAGIKARAVITVDTIKYKQDQSQEDPPFSFAPPIGTGSTSDSYYQYVVNFPEVVEAYMPDINGVKLGAFTKGQTQVINYSWTKDHAWGDSNKVWLYDSTDVHVVVYLENDSTMLAGGGAPNKYVYQSARAAIVTGIEELSTKNAAFEMYPNPANNNVNVVFKLGENSNVNIEVFNLLGEKVYSVNKGKTPAGVNKVELNTSNFNTGIYFVKLTTDSGSSTKKLVIQK